MACADGKVSQPRRSKEEVWTGAVIATLCAILGEGLAPKELVDMCPTHAKMLDDALEHCRDLREGEPS